MIPEGMHDIPAGHMAAVVTHLQMFAPQMAEALPFPEGFTATREVPPVADYLALFRKVGAPWLWTSRLEMPVDEVAAIISADETEIWIIRRGQTPVGIVELEFQEGGDCELAFFGVVKDLTGQGLGKAMMALAQSRAFARDIKRFWVHTCNWDDPRALGFYRKAGFVPYRIAVEVSTEPRSTGIHPPETAPHVPLLP
jgi:ribosomal protein S18 acetylase RimI-like enzyme